MASAKQIWCVAFQELNKLRRFFPMVLKRYERLLYTVAGFIVLMTVLFVVQKIIYSQYRVPKHLVWEKVIVEAEKHDLDPNFVYAIVFAESSFRPHASNTGGNGIMQVSERTWGSITDEPYDRVWDWKLNIEVGTAYLSWCKQYLETKKEFSYPLVAACYNSGPNAVRKKKFQIESFQKTNNRIYKKLFLGDISPLESPTKS